MVGIMLDHGRRTFRLDICLFQRYKVFYVGENPPEMSEAVPEGPFLKRADRGGSAM